MTSWTKWRTRTTGESERGTLAPPCVQRGSANNNKLKFSADGVVFVCRKTVHDKQTGSDIVLSEEQVELVNRLQRGQFGDVNFDEYQVRSGDAGAASP